MAHKEQDDRNENRLCEVTIRLQFKQKKRVYNSIKLFAKRYRTAKGFLKTLVLGNDKANKDTVMRRWKDYNHKNTLSKITEQQD